MLAKVESSAIIGIEAVQVDVEVDVSSGLPQFAVVGLPDMAVKESIKRVKAAIKNSGYNFLNKKITINLSPASIKKGGSCFDLPIAVGLLTATGIIPQEKLIDKVICGELSLDGTVRPVRGVLSRAVSLPSNKKFILPKQNAFEAAIVKSVSAHPVSNLKEVVQFLNENTDIAAVKVDSEKILQRLNTYRLNFSEVKGQEHVKRGLEVAAAGGHNVLMVGPPGSGKTMLAKRIPSILSKMTLEESLETTKIHSVAGLLSGKNTLVSQRPFRSPHHSIYEATFAGGGPHPVPGEISLAHNGVLFLDELPEFKRNVLETLRQPAESGEITISRVNGSVNYPARFMLVAAMNPCPCGYLTDRKKVCQCNPYQVQRYLSKISGPLLDRIDIYLELNRLSYEELSGIPANETSEMIRERVEKARVTQKDRYENHDFSINAHLESKMIEKYCELDNECKELLKMAILELGISARAYDKILKVSRTIADLEGSERIKNSHLTEAIAYRSINTSLWG